MSALLARVVVVSMAGVAVFVQLAVWGATKIRSDGALLEEWQPYLGWEYGIVFALAQLALCRWLDLDRGPVWLAWTWAVGGALVLLACLVRGDGGLPPADSSVALVSGLGGLVLAVGLYDGRLVPGGDRRRAHRREP